MSQLQVYMVIGLNSYSTHLRSLQRSRDRRLDWKSPFSIMCLLSSEFVYKDESMALLEVVLVLVCFCPTGAFPQSGLDLGGRRTQRDVPCAAHLEYRNGNICCLNCPAGKYMKSPCSTAGKMGQCEECEDGTFTEHSNGLKQCFRCTQCRSDQEIVQPCTSTHNFECQCKSGRFCDPDQACEVCKKCSRCGQDEVIARNCTSTSNTECKKRPLPSGTTSGYATLIALIALIVVVFFIGAVVYWWKKNHSIRDSVRSPSDGLKVGLDFSANAEDSNSRKPSSSSLSLPRVSVRSKFSAVKEDECKELCESLTSTASNSQDSLSSPPAFVSHPPVACSLPNIRSDEPLLNLVPVEGEESLKRCFDYFEDLDVNYHSRFFRYLGINDNKIKSKGSLCYIDRVHELLNDWMEKEGGDASLNDLLKALLNLDQRRTAEIIRMKAIEHGHYICK